MKTEISEIVKLFFEERGFDKIQKIDLFESGALDSMAIIELVVFLEENLDISFDAEQMIGDNFRSLDSIIKLIERTSN